MPLLVKRNIGGSEYTAGQVLDDDTEFFNLRSLIDLGWVEKVTEKEIQDMQGITRPTNGIEETAQPAKAASETVQPSKAVEAPIQPTKETTKATTAKEVATTKGSTKSVTPTKGA